MKKVKHKFRPKGVWIPNEVLWNYNLSPFAKLVFSVLETLNGFENITVDTAQLASRFGVTEQVLNDAFANLMIYDYIEMLSFPKETQTFEIKSDYLTIHSDYKHFME